jgi:hypothetical protein
VQYSGDTNYNADSASVTINVSKVTPTVTFGAIAGSMYQSSTLPVTITVNAVTGVSTPTGTVTLTSGTYSSSAQTINGSGVLNFTIPAWSLTPGSDTITATYNGDTNYNTASQASTSITVTQSTYTIAATAVTLTAGATTGNTSTITVTPSGQYVGTVTWTAAVQSSPAGAVSLPTFTYSPGAGLTFTASSSAAQNGNVTVNTIVASAIKAPGSGPLTQHAGLIKSTGWFTAAGGTLLASFLLCFVPRSRKWRKMMMVLLLACAAGFTVIGCGSKSTPPLLTPTVSVTPPATNVSYTSPSNTITISVTGSGVTPTGTVTLSSGSYTSAATPLTAGSATITIPANTFTSAGAITLNASYSGDTVYSPGSGSHSETLTAPGTTTGLYVIKVTAVGTDPLATTQHTTFNLTVN